MVEQLQTQVIGARPQEETVDIVRCHTPENNHVLILLLKTRVCDNQNIEMLLIRKKKRCCRALMLAGIKITLFVWRKRRLTFGRNWSVD